MDDKIKLNLKNDDIEKGKKLELKAKNNGTDKSWLIFLLIGILSLIGGTICVIIAAINPFAAQNNLLFPEIIIEVEPERTYSSLTGEILDDPSLKDAPLYCIQIPNGLDGARPQVGLTQAGVIFEAIAEAGITRFAAIFQNPTQAIIGPIRSLRLYYLDWDTPFDCAIVHAGGSYEALEAVRSGKYKDLTENYAYMYRGSSSGRLWNNLFTTSENLKRFSKDTTYNTARVKGFLHYTVREAEMARIDALVREKLVITKAASDNTAELSPNVELIRLNFGNVPAFNIQYSYDQASNKYYRSYETGASHEVYECPNEDIGEVNPESVCALTQMAPSVVIAMMVDERKAPDNYHERITTTGSGEAYIFQNGSAYLARWDKPTVDDQLRFLDKEGNEIPLMLGQIFISAIPGYGGVEY